MDHVSIGNGNERFLLGRQKQFMNLVYELSLGWFLGKYRTWQILLSTWQALKLPSQEGHINEVFFIFLEDFKGLRSLNS